MAKCTRKIMEKKSPTHQVKLILKIVYKKLWNIGKTVIFQKKKKSVKKSGQTLKMNQKYFVFPMHEFQVLSRQKVCWSTNYALQRTSNWTVFMTHRFLSLFCVYQSRSSKTQTLKKSNKKRSEYPICKNPI